MIDKDKINKGKSWNPIDLMLYAILHKGICEIEGYTGWR